MLPKAVPCEDADIRGDHRMQDFTAGAISDLPEITKSCGGRGIVVPEPPALLRARGITKLQALECP
jgi:hypothetical protein